RCWHAYVKPQNSDLPSLTRGRSRMRESRTYGSVRGAGSNLRPYRDRLWPVARVGSYLGYSGRTPNVVANAALDPQQTSRRHRKLEAQWHGRHRKTQEDLCHRAEFIGIGDRERRMNALAIRVEHDGDQRTRADPVDQTRGAIELVSEWGKERK